jgi:Na+/H+-dicarboxylate symporter/ABC-type amino acid transport substrate-binding protein
MTSSQKVLAGLVLGIAAGLFFGEAIASIDIVANAFVRLLQMTVLPYVTLSIVVNLGSLTYAKARQLALGAGAVLGLIWTTALVFAFLLPTTLPSISNGTFFSPALAGAPEPFNFLDLYVAANPFNALANNVVPAVVLFSVLLGLALIGVERKQPLLDVVHTAISAIGRTARFIVRLTPLGIFAIAAHAAGTLDIEQLRRIEVYLVAYIALSLLLSLWVLPGLITALTPISGREALWANHGALLTAFLVGDLFIVLPSLIETCEELIEKRLGGGDEVRELPGSIVPTSFTFPHAGKLLSLSFILFAGWFSDSAVPPFRYPELAVTGFFSFFGSLNVAVPFLLDQFRIPADTFQLFLATGVLNQRFGTLLAAVHTIAVGLLGSAAMAGRLQIRPAGLARFAATTAAATVLVLGGLRVGFETFLDAQVDSRAIVYAMQPLSSSPVSDADVRSADAVPADSIPDPGQVLDNIRARKMLRVGLIADGIPFAYRNHQGQVVGFDIEMAQQLAQALGSGLEFVRFPATELDNQIHRRTIDIVMTGSRVTPERAASFATSQPYLDETLAIVTEDHRRGEFQSWAVIREMGAVVIGVQNLPYYLTTIRELLPEANLQIIPETTELIDANSPYAAYLLPAERGSVLTMLNPRFAVVIPEGTRVRMPLAYPIAGDDPAWIRFVNTWIDMKKRDGFIDRLYDHWILGKDATPKPPRWSVMRDVLHWVD